MNKTVGGSTSHRWSSMRCGAMGGAWEFTLMGPRCPEDKDESVVQPAGCAGAHQRHGSRHQPRRIRGTPAAHEEARYPGVVGRGTTPRGTGIRDSWIPGDLSMNGDGAAGVRGIPSGIRTDFGRRCSDLVFCVWGGCCVD